MEKVILLCGKICSGKTTYGERLRRQEKAVLLSVDEIMLSLFGQQAGELHDTYVKRTKKYLLDKSAELIESGIGVILDWGVWTKRERSLVRGFYESRGIPCELHYIDIDEESWRARIEKRNRAVQAGKADAYFVDEGLAAKFAALFEAPEEGEIDRRVRP